MTQRLGEEWCHATGSAGINSSLLEGHEISHYILYSQDVI